MKLFCWLGLGLSLPLLSLSCTKKPADSAQSSMKALKASETGPDPAAAQQAPMDPVHAGLALTPNPETGEVRAPYRPNPREQRQLQGLAEEAKTFAHLKNSPSKGLATYKKHCASCHGEEGRGDGRSGDDLPVAATNFHEWNIKYGRTPEMIALTTLEGRNDDVMPGYRGIMSPEETWSVVFLVSSWIDTRPDNAK